MNLPRLIAVLFLVSVTSTVFAQKSLPDVSIQELNGKKINIQDYADNDKVTVLSFWATWCVPCKKELDNIGWEYEVLSDKNSDLKRALNFQAVPYTMVIDTEGNIVYTHDGYVEGDEFELEDVLKKLSEK